MATRKKKNSIGAFGHPIYGKGFAKYGEMQPNGSSEISNDLEEAADDYIGKVVDDGWEWETHDIVEAFIAGAKWQKEQMMKEAVEGEIQMRYSGCLCAKTIRAINEGKFKFGDKVRVIVLPKED